MRAPWRIENLAFQGSGSKTAELSFSRPLTFVYGASNTGKTFAVKAIDFMLGGNRELPEVPERRLYNRITLRLKLSNTNTVTLERAIVGGDFRLTESDGSTKTLAWRHNRDRDDNLSSFLLGHLDSKGKLIAEDKSGTKRSLSFRDIARLCIADEIAIQAETSPVLSGDVATAPGERNVFKYMLTGDDDAAMITHLKPKDFRTGRTAQVRFLEDMIADIDAELAQEFPDKDSLKEQFEKVEASRKKLETDIVAARASVRLLLDEKRQLIAAIGLDQRRAYDIAVSLSNFAQLKLVYVSDVARLESLEEAGFLLAIDSGRPCPVCGAAPEAQRHDHGLGEIEKVRIAAEVEIAKIKTHQSELDSTIADAEAELSVTTTRLQSNQNALEILEEKLKAASPDVEEQQQKFADIIPKRDRINYGLDLFSRREDLESQRVKISKSKQVRRETNFQAGLSTQVAQEFADEVASILTIWDFPGERRVVFDPETQDLIIDSKHRKHNGKGVRAITHAAFKVALLTYCKKRNLAHPGFLILDTPLITYRDPMRSAAGVLTPDEEELLRTDLKERFFQHLGSLTGSQIILLDNTDPPPNALSFASIETFTNNTEEGRQGLL